MIYFLLFGFSALALVCFHFGWRSPETFSRYRARGGFFLCVFFFIPAILASIWAQAGGQDRLRAAGVAPHPAIVSPQGLSVGLGAPPRTWVFDLSEPGEQALRYYRDPQNLAGWQFSRDTSRSLSSLRDGERLIIVGGAESSLIYLLYPAEGDTTIL